MKIYVAGGLDTRHEVAALMRRLEQAGHVVTYDWTVHGPVEPDRCQAVAHAELDGVTRADALVVRLPGGKGTHVELGAALATRLPVLILRDQPAAGREPSFYSHDLVTQVPRPDGGAEAEAAAVVTWLRLLPDVDDEDLEDLWGETHRVWSTGRRS